MQVNFYVEKTYVPAWERFRALISTRGIGQAIFYMCTDPGCVERVAWEMFLAPTAQLTIRDARIRAVLTAAVDEQVRLLHTVYGILLPRVSPGDTDVQLVAKLGMKDGAFMSRARELWDRTPSSS